MKANELRIGNWVEYKGEVYQVFNGIYKGCCDLDSEILDQNIPHVSLENIRGVKLREEILLKCGFYEILGYFIELCNVGNEFYNCGFKGKTIGEIKHLHQLQNLYWCLCQKELNVNM